MSITPQFGRSTTTSSDIAVSGTATFTLASPIFDTFTSDYLVLDYNNPTKREVILCSVSGSTVTVISRAQEGTTAVSHSSGASIGWNLVPSHINNLVTQATGGWDVVTDTWTYASASTITVPTGAATKYSKGDKIKLNQATALTSYWSFDTNSADAKGAATMGNVGTPTYDIATKKFGTASLSLDGSTDALTITDAAAFKPTGAFTIGAWINATASTGLKMIFSSFSQNPTNFAGFNFYVLPNADGGKLRVDIGNNSAASGYDTLTGATDVRGGWHHVVLSSQGNFTKIFVDGVLDASGYTRTLVYAASNYVRVGCSDSNGSTNANWFLGQIDDLFFINGQALSEEYVAAKYAATTAQGSGDVTMTKYFYVTGVADTLLTINGGADFLWSNITVTDNYYSKAVSPVGFPRWFSHIPTVKKNDNSTALTHSTLVCDFTLNGRNLSGRLHIADAGDPSGSGIYATLPVRAATRGGLNISIIGAYVESGGTGGGGYIAISANATDFLLTRVANANWGASANVVAGTFNYEIA